MSEDWDTDYSGAKADRSEVSSGFGSEPVGTGRGRPMFAEVEDAVPRSGRGRGFPNNSDSGNNSSQGYRKFDNDFSQRGNNYGNRGRDNRGGSDRFGGNRRGGEDSRNGYGQGNRYRNGSDENNEDTPWGRGGVRDSDRKDGNDEHSGTGGFRSASHGFDADNERNDYRGGRGGGGYRGGGGRRGGFDNGNNDRSDNGFRGGNRRGGGYGSRFNDDERNGESNDGERTRGGFRTRGGGRGGFDNDSNDWNKGREDFRGRGRGGRFGGSRDHGDSEQAGNSEDGDMGGGGFRGRRGRGGNFGGGGNRYSRESDEGRTEESNGGFRPRGGGQGGGFGRPDSQGEDGEERPRIPLYIPPEPSNLEEDLFVGIPTGINFDKYKDIRVNASGRDPPRPINSFSESGLREQLQNNINRAKYTTPTPVQKYAIPAILSGRDLMATAQTGSGKTAAFLLPILQCLLSGDIQSASFKETQTPYALVISPTRELAIQIHNEVRKFAYDTIIKTTILYGGVSTGYQIKVLMNGCHILIATVGRLLDCVRRGKVDFSEIRFLVLDEADKMLEMGFITEIRSIMSHSTMPKVGERQTMMFTATFPEEIQAIAKDYLNDYVFVTVGIVGGANTDVEQIIVNIEGKNKKDELRSILEENPNEQVIVFVSRKRDCDFISSLLCQWGIRATSIHGDRTQEQREEALWDFKSGKMQVLVASSVASRGLDIKDVAHVVNYDLPDNKDEYVHRIGRTGRVGNTGRATSFYDSESNSGLARELVTILSQANQNVPDWLENEAHHAVGTRSSGFNRSGFGGVDIRSRREYEDLPPSNDMWDGGAGVSQPLEEAESWD